MQVREVMTRNVESIPPMMPVRDAARKMREMNVGVLPVKDERRILGMLTDRDIAIRAVAEGRDPNQTLAAEVMTSDAVSCYEDEDISVMERKMKEQQIRRMLVMDRDQQLVGIVSLGDLAMIDDGKHEHGGEVLKEVSKPSEPIR